MSKSNRLVMDIRRNKREMELEGEQFAKSIVQMTSGSTVEEVRSAVDPDRNVITLAVVVGDSLAHRFERATHHRINVSGRQYEDVRKDRLSVATRLLGIETLGLNDPRVNIRLVTADWTGLSGSNVRLGRQAA